MEFRDLKTQYQRLAEEMNQAVLTTLAAGRYIGGEPVAELERQLADYVGVKHCLTCANGTDALSLILMAWGVGPGDAVFVPDFTFFATAEVVSYCGATPVFVDVDARTFNLDPERLAEAIASVRKQGKLTPKVVIPVDLFGLPADYDALIPLARRENIKVLADSAQGFGGRINNRVAGSFGDAATTSFFPAKPLGCYGDGGAVFTDDDALAELIASLKFHGKGSFKYDNVRIGVNSRLDTLQAAILQVKFKAFKAFELDAVNQVAARYGELLAEQVTTPLIPEGFYSSYAQYTLTLPTPEIRDFLQEELKKAGIPSMVYYPKPLHQQTAFRDLPLPDYSLETTKSLCDRVLSLPMHPYLTAEEVERIAATVSDALQTRGAAV